MNTLLVFEKIFTVISLLHYLGGPMFVIVTNGISEGDIPDIFPEVPLINQAFLAIYVVTFSLLLLRWKKVIVVISKSRLVWLLLGVAVLSIFWSYSPDISRTRVIALTGTMLFSLYFASRYSLKEQLQLLGWVFGIAVVTSLIFIALLPKYGLMAGSHSGAWRGIYNHKNVLGKNMVPSIIVFLLLALTAKKQQWIFWVLDGTSLVLLVFSRSSSSLINLLILLVIFSILHILRWGYILMIPTLTGTSSLGIILYSFLAANADQLAGAIGKDLTLTGRTNFWPLMIDKIWERPLLGYGFGAFWQGVNGPSAYVWNASSFKMPNGHNGYLDLCLELGFIGLLIYSIEFINIFFRALTYIRFVRTPDAFWPILFLCYIILSNLTESSLLIQNNFLWAMQASIFFSLSIPQSEKTEKILNPAFEET